MFRLTIYKQGDRQMSLAACAKGCQCGIDAIGRFLQPILLLAIRLYWGYAFLMAGYGKLQNIAPVIKFFTSLNIPYPEISAYLVGVVELVGGLLLILGLWSRIAAFPLAIVMIVALYTAHYDAVQGIVDNPQRFINQLPFNYLMTTLIVLAFGPGVFSIDYIRGRRKD